MKGKVGTVRGYARFKNKKNAHLCNFIMWFIFNLPPSKIHPPPQKLTHRLQNFTPTA
jgi:hypothetical protein